MRVFRIFHSKIGLVALLAILAAGLTACAAADKAGEPPDENSGQLPYREISQNVQNGFIPLNRNVPQYGQNGLIPPYRIFPENGPDGQMLPYRTTSQYESNIHIPPNRQIPPIRSTGPDGSNGVGALHPQEMRNPYLMQRQNMIRMQRDVPPPQNNALRTADAGGNVRGIYVSGRAAGSKVMMDKLLNLLERTDLNAVVLDIKNDYGRLTYDSTVPLADETGADGKPPVKNISAFVERLKGKNIYVIGRIVVFKDPHLAKTRTDLAIRKKNGRGVWRDGKGVAWVDPYVEEVRQYNLELAKEAARLGFDEIQFDYVRFPDNGRKVDAEVRYRNAEGASKAELIGSFLAEARRELHVLGVPVSADVFGLTTTAKDDMDIGQRWEQIAANVDFISPMVYPSHYAKGSYGVKHPDLNPRTIVAEAIRDAIGRNKAMERQAANQTADAGTKNDGTNRATLRPADIRPWLQCFTARWVKPHRKYGKAEIEAQIEAVRSLGIRGYLLWDPTCRYAPLAD